VRSWKIKNCGEFYVLRWRSDGVPEADVHLNLDSRLLQVSYHNNPHPAIIEILADFIPFDCLDRKAETVRLELNGADVSEDLFEPLDTAFATSNKVEITCGAVRTPAPQGK